MYNQTQKKMKILVQFSGGKDSLATLIWARNNFGKKITAIFCDTKWEHDKTYKHIEEVIKQMGVEIVNLTSKKYDGFVDMALQKKRFPSTKARFCTEELKVKPFIDYILELNEDVLIVQGIRSDESFDRSKMQSQCSYFKYYFEPFLTNSMIVEKLGNRDNLTTKQQKKLTKAIDRLSIGKEDPQHYSYRKKEVTEFVKKNADDVLRPIFEWNVMQVFEFIKENGYKPNELYLRGFGRVGCMPCIMAKKSEVKAIIDFEPEYFDRIVEAEIKVGRTFFPPKYIPSHASQKRKFATANEVKRYVEGKNETMNIFEQNKSCSSFYSLCE